MPLCSRLLEKEGLQMTGEQYVRASKKVYSVVMAQLIVMTLLAGAACLTGLKAGTVIQVLSAVAGIILINAYARKFFDCKKGAMLLLGIAAGVYFIFMIFNQSNYVYAYALPLMTASIIYLNVRFLYYGGTVAILGNIIHIILQVIRGKADAEQMIFSVVIWAMMVYAVYHVSVMLTKFHEENLQKQRSASGKMSLVAENLLKHFDSANASLERLEEVIHNNSESISNIADSTGSTAETIQQQAMMCDEIHKSTDAAEKETQAMIERSNHTMENVAEGSRLVAGLKEQANSVEEASNLAAESTRQLSNRVEEVKGIVATILSISSQTNLLALNASIEAARAGEAGKGFAVVADEIRQLSEQTKDATNRITDIIRDLNMDAEQAMHNMENSARSIQEQNELIETTKDKFEMIDGEMQTLAEVIARIEDVMKSILTSTDMISESISNLSAASQEVAASSAEGLQTANGAVETMQKTKEIIEATYMLAQDLKTYAE